MAPSASTARLIECNNAAAMQLVAQSLMWSLFRSPWRTNFVIGILSCSTPVPHKSEAPSNAAVEYVDHAIVKPFSQQHFESRRIRRDVGFARGGGRSYGHDLYLALPFEALRQVWKRILEIEKIEVRVARP
ncbi:MAG: hypothetical protein ACJ8FZ_09590 [Bradyrhizobium sp.]